MDLRIDDYKLEKSNMTVPEILTLNVLNEHNDMSSILESLQNAGFISGFANDNVTFLSITNVGQMLLNRIVQEQSKDESVSEDDERLTAIAEAMREIYPKGFKKDDYGQDAYPWRGSTNMIKERLRKFEQNYYGGKKLNLEDVIETTRRYVDSCKKRDPVLLRVMKTLKYFIYKDNESLLLEWLDTEQGEDAYDESNGMTIL